jgi:hypothetical protein
VTPANLLKIDLDGKLAQRSPSFFRLWTVQRAAEIKCQGLWMAGGNVALPGSVGQRRADQTQRLIAGNDFADKWFAAMVRRNDAPRASWTCRADHDSNDPTGPSAIDQCNRRDGGVDVTAVPNYEETR